MAAVALPAGLGIWQLERREWKLDLIGAVEARAGKPPLTRADGVGPEDEYRTIRLDGTFIAGTRFLIQSRTLRGRAGFGVVAPFRLRDGRTVLVDRGWIDAAHRPADRPAPDRVVGTVRFPRPPGWFGIENDPAGGTWFRIDPRAMGRELGTAVEPFHVRASGSGDGWPKPFPANPGLRNDHLRYALTWFALALAAAVIAVLAFVRGRRR